MNSTLIRTAAAAITCTLAGTAFAQTRADGQWRGTGGAALAATSGNTTASSLLLTAETSRASERDKISLGGAINYARSKNNGINQTTSNKWGVAGEYDYNLSPRLFVFGRLGLEGDKLIFLSRRTALASGLGYKVVDTPTMTFELYGGAGYSTDRYSRPRVVDGKTDTSFSRASLYLGEESTHELSSTTSFKQRLDLYPGLSGDKAMLAKFTAGLSVAMSSTMSLNVGLIDTYNSKPAAGAKSNDLGLFTGVNVKFGAL